MYSSISVLVICYYSNLYHEHYKYSCALRPPVMLGQCEPLVPSWPSGYYMVP